jgi:hypothetical protein
VEPSLSHPCNHTYSHSSLVGCEWKLHSLILAITHLVIHLLLPASWIFHFLILARTHPVTHLLISVCWTFRSLILASKYLVTQVLLSVSWTFHFLNLACTHPVTHSILSYELNFSLSHPFLHTSSCSSLVLSASKLSFLSIHSSIHSLAVSNELNLSLFNLGVVFVVRWTFHSLSLLILLVRVQGTSANYLSRLCSELGFHSLTLVSMLPATHLC